MSSVDKGITLVEITFGGQCHQWTKFLTFLEITLSGQCHYWTRYNIIRDNIQRAMFSVDKGITLLEITFSGQCHQWTKV